jgi:DNA-directed RNA polymerase specialized sigma24 family protein
MDAAGTLAEVLKGEGPRVLAPLARTIGDLAVAEDALSEATITALEAWPETGIPDNPRAWLAVVARRKALDLLRRESARAAKETAAFRWGTGAAPDQIEEAIKAMEPETSLRDDMLRLIFTCCHPALSREAQVALSPAGRPIPASGLARPGGCIRGRQSRRSPALSGLRPPGPVNPYRVGGAQVNPVLCPGSRRTPAARPRPG